MQSIGAKLAVAAVAATAYCQGAAQSGAADALLPFAVAGDAVPAPLGGLSGDAARGLALIRDRRIGNCLICHRLNLADEPFQGEIGPPLEGVGSRLTAGQIRLRLIDQSRINPDTVMPPYYRTAGLVHVAPEYQGRPALDAQQIEDMVVYLTTLKD